MAEKKLAIILSEKKMDKVLAALMLAVTAGSMGQEAHIFFTFWAVDVLKKKFKPKLGGIMRFFTGMMVGKMKKLGIATFDDLMEQAKEIGVKFYACNTTVKLMGYKKEDLIDCDIVGAAGFLKIAHESSVQIYI